MKDRAIEQRDVMTVAVIFHHAVQVPSDKAVESHEQALALVPPSAKQISISTKLAGPRGLPTRETKL